MSSQGQARQGEAGQIVILVALLMTVLLLFLALIFDAGRLTAESRVTQNAGDAASLAGLRQTLGEFGNGTYNDRRVRRTLARYAQDNGLPSDGTPENYTYIEAYYRDRDGGKVGAQVGKNFLVPSEAVSVEVKLKRPSRYLFAGLLGKSSLQISTAAKAAFEQKKILMPLGIPKQPLSVGQKYDLRDSKVAKDNYGIAGYKGNFDLANWFNQGVDYQAGAIYGDDRDNAERWSQADGYNGQQNIADVIAVTQRNVNSAVRDGLRYNITQQNLTDEGGLFGYIYVLVWNQYRQGKFLTPDTVVLSQFASFKVYERDVETDSIDAYFLGYTNEPIGKIDLLLAG